MKSAEINSLFERLIALPHDMQTAVLFMTFGGAQATLGGNPKAKLIEYFNLLEIYVARTEGAQAANRAA